MISPRWYRILASIAFGVGAAGAQRITSESGPVSLADATKLKSPIPYTKKSIAAGKGVFLRNCVGCHGPDGKAMVDVVADATDLTDPKGWRNGHTEGEIFRSIRDGQGASMPAFKSQLRQDDIWQLVNYIRSLWPEAMRPTVQESDQPQSAKDK